MDIQMDGWIFNPVPPYGRIIRPEFFTSETFQQEIGCNFKQHQRTGLTYRISSCGECTDCFDPNKGQDQVIWNNQESCPQFAGGYNTTDELGTQSAA